MITEQIRLHSVPLPVLIDISLCFHSHSVLVTHGSNMVKISEPYEVVCSCLIIRLVASEFSQGPFLSPGCFMVLHVG